MKTKITINQINRNEVTVERDDPFFGDRITTIYFAPHNGGYVRIRDAAGRYPQVCERLCGTGNTLYVDSIDELPALIRREHRRRVAAERREIS